MNIVYSYCQVKLKCSFERGYFEIGALFLSVNLIELPRLLECQIICATEETLHVSQYLIFGKFIEISHFHLSFLIHHISKNLLKKPWQI